MGKNKAKRKPAAKRKSPVPKADIILVLFDSTILTARRALPYYSIPRGGEINITDQVVSVILRLPSAKPVKK